MDTTVQMQNLGLEEALLGGRKKLNNRPQCDWHANKNFSNLDIPVYRRLDEEATLHAHDLKVHQIEDLNPKAFPDDIFFRFYTPQLALRETPDVVAFGVKFESWRDRDLFESTPAGSGIVTVPHMAPNDNTPRHLRLEEIVKKTGCDIRTAVIHRDFLKKLDATEEVAESYFALIRRKDDVTPAEKWERHNWRNLFLRIDSVPVLQKEDTDPDEPKAELLPSNFEGFIDIDELPERDTPEGLLPGDSLTDSDVVKYHPLADADQLDWLERQPKWFRAVIQFVKQATFQQLSEISALAFGNTWEKYELKARAAGLGARDIKCLRYLVNWRDIRSDGRPAYEMSEGRLRWAFKVNDKAILKIKAFLQDCLPPFTRSQASVFWTYHGIRKTEVSLESEDRWYESRYLTRSFVWGSLEEVESIITIDSFIPGRKLNSPARQVRKKIEAAANEKQLGYVAFKMSQLQKHEIGTAACWPQGLEWKVLWKEWHSKKESFQSDGSVAGRQQEAETAPATE